MRVAFIGKGGSGKTTIAGTVARLLARDGERVLALDVDTMPGLALSLGLGSVPNAGLPEDLAERQEGKGWVIRGETSAEAIVDRHGLDAPDGIRFLQLGKLPGHVKPASSVAFRHVLDGFRRDGWSLVGDLAAGTRQVSGGWAGFASIVAIVVEPTRASLVSAQRLRTFLAVPGERKVGLVVNKVRSDSFLRPAQIAAELQLPLWLELPYDDAVAAAERNGKAPLDAAADSAGVKEIADLLKRLRELAGKARDA